ncbi:hypothetical protein NKJ88_30655, partial [Mesorhizobium sp. M0016]|uniref:hypothetical protein n=1 Tax=Mesorhizobium sp. M0016 TaxID=2956843 RepID=UPI00333AB0D1
MTTDSRWFPPTAKGRKTIGGARGVPRPAARNPEKTLERGAYPKRKFKIFVKGLGILGVFFF